MQMQFGNLYDQLRDQLTDQLRDQHANLWAQWSTLLGSTNG
jgi:hypothetical protein